MDNRGAAEIGISIGAGFMAMSWMGGILFPRFPAWLAWSIFAAGAVLVIVSIVVLIKPKWFAKTKKDDLTIKGLVAEEARVYLTISKILGVLCAIGTIIDACQGKDKNLKQ